MKTKLNPCYTWVVICMFLLTTLIMLIKTHTPFEGEFFGQQKHIRHVYTNKYPLGMGDFIRGSLTIAKICKNKGYTFDVDYSMNSISNYMINRKINHNIVTNVSQIIHGEYKVYTNTEMSEFIDDQVQKSSSNVLFLGTFNPHVVYPIDYDIRSFIRDSFLPNDEMKAYIQQIKRQLLNNENIKYNIVHVRVGDHVLVSKSSESNQLYKSIQYQVTQQLKKVPNKFATLVISDDTKLKEYLVRNEGLIGVPTIPRHSKDNGNMKDTLIDFFLLCGASAIVQHSSYKWGSGFSDRAADLYSIPIYKTKPNDYT